MKKTVFLAAMIAALLATDLCVAQNTSRGVRREQEQCEALALQPSVSPRASGSGTSRSETVALNIAKLEARNELASQIAVEISSFMQHRVEQIMMTAGANTDVNVRNNSYRGNVSNSGNAPRTVSAVWQKDIMVIEQYVSQQLTNVVPICRNSYNQPDGSVMVYVCLEMNPEAQSKMYIDLKEAGILVIDVNGDGLNSIDISEQEFLMELAKAREEYNKLKIES